jgi:hypothetical protein
MKTAFGALGAMVPPKKLRIVAVGMGRLEGQYIETTPIFQHIADILIVASRDGDGICGLVFIRLATLYYCL